MSELERILEALIFLSDRAVGVAALAAATGFEPAQVEQGLQALQAHYADGQRGLVLRQVAGGYAFATDPIAEAAARQLLSKPRTPALSQAQAETLAIVAYQQPVSRPEVARIRGVGSESAAAVLVERGLLEESGTSEFGAAMYRTTDLFLKLFGLNSLQDLPDPSQWDPTPEQAGNLRERLLRAGAARVGTDPSA